MNEIKPQIQPEMAVANSNKKLETGQTQDC